MATVNFWMKSRSDRRQVNTNQWFSLLLKAVHGVRQGWRAYTRYNRLCKLSDQALRDRGLRHEEIGRHSFFRDDF